LVLQIWWTAFWVDLVPSFYSLIRISLFIIIVIIHGRFYFCVKWRVDPPFSCPSTFLAAYLSPVHSYRFFIFFHIITSPNCRSSNILILDYIPVWNWLWYSLSFHVLNKVTLILDQFPRDFSLLFHCFLLLYGYGSHPPWVYHSSLHSTLFIMIYAHVSAQYVDKQ
jgi:hypothetical protein